jgi:hypothetical protein
VSPDFDRIQRDILAGVPLKKILRQQSIAVEEIQPDGSVVTKRLGVDMEFLEAMAERLKADSSPGHETRSEAVGASGDAQATQGPPTP